MRECVQPEPNSLQKTIKFSQFDLSVLSNAVVKKVRSRVHATDFAFMEVIFNVQNKHHNAVSIRTHFSQAFCRLHKYIASQLFRIILFVAIIMDLSITMLKIPAITRKHQWENRDLYCITSCCFFVSCILIVNIFSVCFD